LLLEFFLKKEVRQIKYINNIVEQDRCFIKKRVRSMLGLKSFPTAKSILSGIEAMHIIKKGQLILRDKSVQNEMRFIHQLFERGNLCTRTVISI
jgi:transposase, IS6 family